MPTTNNGFQYEELEGSPELEYNEQGVSAIRRFLVPWANYEAFVQELAGFYSTVGNQTIFTGHVPFPGSRANMICVAAKVKPFDPSKPDGSAITGPLASGANAYANGALVEAQYKTLNLTNQGGSNQGQSNPTAPDGTFYSYDATYGAQYLTLPAKGWKWSTSGATLKSTTPIGLVIPNIVHNLTWHRLPVSRLPLDTWSAAIGTINVTPFRGYPANSLLFVGMRIVEEFRINDNQMLARVTFSFAEKRVPGDSTLGGWNYFYDPDTNTWDKVVEAGGSGDGPYLEDGFNLLFQLL